MFEAETSPENTFLLGHPRSGTTFLHRFILDNTSCYDGKKLKDMVFHNRFLKVVSEPIMPFLNLIPFNLVYDPHIHETSLNAWETDDICFGIRHKTGYLHWLYFCCLSHNQITHENFFSWIEHNRLNMTSCWQELYDIKDGRSTPFLSKSFILIFLLHELFEFFPRAKYLVMMRSPLDTLASICSLLLSVQQRLHRKKIQDQNIKEQYLKNIYQTVLYFYKELDRVIAVWGNRNNVKLVLYPDLVNNFNSEFKDISEFLGIKISAELATSIENQDKAQKERRSQHQYSLQMFGFSKLQIENDFSFIWEKYNV